MTASDDGPVRYTIQSFRDDLQTALQPAGIAFRVNEDENGTRTISAWERDSDGAVSTFAIDDVAITPDRAQMVATTIRRSFGQESR